MFEMETVTVYSGVKLHLPSSLKGRKEARREDVIHKGII